MEILQVVVLDGGCYWCLIMATVGMGTDNADPKIGVKPVKMRG